MSKAQHVRLPLGPALSSLCELTTAAVLLAMTVHNKSDLASVRSACRELHDSDVSQAMMLFGIQLQQFSCNGLVSRRNWPAMPMHSTLACFYRNACKWLHCN